LDLLEPRTLDGRPQQTFTGKTTPSSPNWVFPLAANSNFKPARVTIGNSFP